HQLFQHECFYQEVVCAGHETGDAVLHRGQGAYHTHQHLVAQPPIPPPPPPPTPPPPPPQKPPAPRRRPPPFFVVRRIRRR
ncbi:hypothetical protein, partial [Nocardia abscessus]|uniref:hypothetical protein n=1 Tax=Nocardia abscessus TaxID=120957 RepID=UPI003CC7CC58